jgi:hypothetical protein
MKLNLSAAAMALFATGLAAHAASYSFSYTTPGGDVLAGTVEGTLQADGDTIFVSDFGPVSFSGIALADIEPDDIASVSDFPTGALQPIMSLSGASMDVFVCSEGFDASNCSFASTGGFFIDTVRTVPNFSAGDGLGYQIVEPYDASGFTISAAVVPLPAAAAMLAAAMGAFGAVGVVRRRRTARA